jgi:MOSC domain-containing protein YiiM
MRAMHARGGVVCRLLSSGTIRAGDAVVWDDPTDAQGTSR